MDWPEGWRGQREGLARDGWLPSVGCGCNKHGCGPVVVMRVMKVVEAYVG